MTTTETDGFEAAAADENVEGDEDERVTAGAVVSGEERPAAAAAAVCMWG